MADFFTLLIIAGLVIVFFRLLYQQRFKPQTNKIPLTAKIPLIDRIEDLLPQTQCGQCGYAGCRPYAEAMSQGEAINQCPPGGEKTISRLANLLHVQALPLNPENGITRAPMRAFIREDECIGCTKCITACPVDAILGAAKFMHTVIEAECTGCDLCVEPCPVDCIDMLPIASSTISPSPIPLVRYFRAGKAELKQDNDLRAAAKKYKSRFHNNQKRITLDKLNREEKRKARLIAREKNQGEKSSFSAEKARSEILAAVARVKAKKSGLKK